MTTVIICHSILASDDITSRNYLNQLYEYFEQTYVLNLASYVGVFEYGQPCPVCNDPHTMGDFLTLCYANCTSNIHPYIFDNTFRAYTETQCHRPFIQRRFQQQAIHSYYKIMYYL
jgi:hypothetical protein